MWSWEGGITREKDISETLCLHGASVKLGPRALTCLLHLSISPYLEFTFLSYTLLWTPSRFESQAAKGDTKEDGQLVPAFYE